jgi:glutathione S-transferase
LKVWFHPESPYARRVLCFLDWNKIDAERIPVSLEQREHRGAEYLKVNPWGRVPAILDGDFALSESLAILRYLVDRDGLFSWYPKDLRGRAVADQWLEYVSQHACRPFLDLAWERTMAARFAGRSSPGVEELAVKRLKRELPILNARLAESPFLAGANPTLADVALYPFVKLSGEAGIDLATDAPELAAWLLRKEKPTDA